MTVRNLYPHIEASLLRFCASFGDENNLAPLNMDAFTDEAQWPDGDFVGFGELYLDITDFYEGQCAFMISTVGDTNLFRMRQHMSKLLDLLLPTSKIPVFHSETGIALGGLYVLDGVRVAPPVVTKTQPIRPVMISFASDLTYS